MADESDVETALVTLCSAALYPSGVNSPSVPGPDCRIYRGWPNSAALDADLTAGRINVTVFPVPRHARTTTRYTQIWSGTPAQPTLTASVSGTSVTFGGTADLGQVAGLLADGQSYAYRTQTGDNPALVAANLASSRPSQCNRSIVGFYANYSRRWQPDSPSGRGRFGPAGSPTTRADLSRHLLVSDTDVTRRGSYRHRSCSCARSAFITLADGSMGQADLCRDDGVRSISGRAALSPRPAVSD